MSAYPPPPPPGYGYGYPPQPPVGPTYASTGRRIGGYLLDALFLSVASGIAGCFIGLGSGLLLGFSGNGSTASLSGDGLGTVVGTVLFFVYFVGSTSIWQRSPGQACVGLRLVSARDGGKPTTGQLFGRYAVLYLMLLPCAIPAIVDAFLIGNDPLRQGWHDKASGILVLHG